METIWIVKKHAMAPKGHGYESTELDQILQGNFKSLFDFCIDAGDICFKSLGTCSKNAQYF